ncbi:MAG: YqaE/Pmp3 family membrane protein [Crocinitomicaceae bacterium]|nr:YqaE/Pmp3 family membrane protein [Crocinitomicaceae bacterium]
MKKVDNNSEEIINTVNFSFEEKTSAVVGSDENKLSRDNSFKSNDVTSLNVVNKKTKSEKLSRPVLKKVSKAESKSAGPSRGVLFILCFLIPWLAVGLATDWDLMPLVFNLLWSLTCIGGIIHALIVVNREA